MVSGRPLIYSNLKRTQKLPFSLPERIMTSSVGVADVRKAPNISEVDGKANLCRKILKYPTLFAFIIAHILHFSDVQYCKNRFYGELTTARRNSIFLPHTSLTSVSTTISDLDGECQEAKVKSESEKWKV